MVEPETNDDDRVLELRNQGQSFGAIARTVGLDRPSDAHEAFRRALRCRPTGEQRVLRDRELARLDTLSRRLQSLPHLTGDRLATQLLVVARLRDQLIEDAEAERAPTH